MRIQHYLCCLFICVTSADIIEPWLPCLDAADCALPWPERDRLSGSRVSQCWDEPWCRNWLQQVAAGARPPGKRDIFMSRGWGAGGMPFSVLYLNSHLRLKQQKLKQQQQQQARQPRFSPAESGGGGAARAAALVSEARLQDYEDTPTVAQPPPPPQAHVSLRPTSLSHKQYAVLPQLFVSYGWGPLGK